MGFLNGNVLRRPHLSLRREWHTLLAATIGTLLTCFAVVALTVPYQFAGGGVLGLALISNYAWGISPAWVLSVGSAFQPHSSRTALPTLSTHAGDIPHA